MKQHASLPAMNRACLPVLLWITLATSSSCSGDETCLYGTNPDNTCKEEPTIDGSVDGQPPDAQGRDSTVDGRDAMPDAIVPNLCGNGTCDEAELCGTCETDCGSCEQATPIVTRGPYLQNVGPTQAVVRWRTQAATPSAVALGPSVDNLALSVTSSEPTTEHEVLITGLTDGARYHYAFGRPDAPLIGADGDHVFRTSPTNATPTRVWIIGDSGTASDKARSVRDAYVAYAGDRPADLMLMLGDNAYNDGTDDEYQAAVFDTYPDILKRTPMWSTLGNHDGASAVSSTESGVYYDILTLPRAGEGGGTASGTEAFYSFDYANVHFVCLDSHDSNRNDDGPMLTWLKQDLAATTKTWIIAFWHHPPYTKGSHDSDTEGRLVDMRENALPILESYGVDVVFGGHSHSYERSLYISGHYGKSDTFDVQHVVNGGDGDPTGDGAYSRAGDEAEGAVYVVAGSSGKTTLAPLNHPVMHTSLLELGSVVLDVDDKTLSATFVDDNESALDSFSITKD